MSEIYDESAAEKTKGGHFVDILSSSESVEAFHENDGIVRCMDGGTEGGLRIAGSGNLLERDKVVFPAGHPAAEFLGKFGVEVSNEPTEVLLPKEKYLGQLKKLVESGVIKCISAHTECGAGGVDFENILRAMNVSAEKIAEMKADAGWQSAVDAHVELFSGALAKAIETDYLWIPLDKMSRESHGHIEEAFFVDFVGGKKPEIAFDSRKISELPNGFTTHPALSDWSNVLDEIEISTGIAKVADKFSPENPFVILLIDDADNPQVTDEMIAEIEKRVEPVRKNVEIKVVSPQI